MAPSIDVYREWLGIQETARPLNYYQLLRLKSFEDDAGLVRTHYRKMNSHVRKYATGEHAEKSQELLNELAKAMLCLTDVQRKTEYDSSLGRKEAGDRRRRTFEEILVANGVVSRDQLTKAQSFADAVGLEIHEAVMQQKMATPDVVMLAYAESIGLPYIELADIGVDMQFAPQIPATLARQHSCVPVMFDGGQLLMASPSPLIPDVEEELRLRLGMPVRSVLCTAASINQVITKFYPHDGPAMVPAPAAQQPAATMEKTKKADKPPAAPLTADEQRKRQAMFAVVAFNLTVMVYFLPKILAGEAGVNFFSNAVVAVVLGVVVAGITFVAAKTMKL
jgi:hypothetical protein